jgi:hypothetical protein
MNFKAYKDDPQEVVVFLSVLFSMSQVGIMCVISKMDNNMHMKSSKRGRFKVVKFPNRIMRLIHQMWDEMVTMIVIKKDNKMVTIFEATLTNVEGLVVIKAPKKQKRRRQWRRKGRR